jgi:hypothetical protein
MKSAVAISYELEDGKIAARELADQIRGKIPLGKNSVGLMFCDADADGAALSGELANILGVEVAGMTTLAEFDESGRHEAAAVLTVLTADDCAYTVSASEPLTDEGVEKTIAETYFRMAPTGYGAKPGMVFEFCPNGMSFSGDKYADALAMAAPGIPTFGGVSSDDYDYGRARVFLSGREYRDSIVLMCVWGNVRPVFSLRHVVSRFTERIRRVARAEGNVVYSVGGETLIEYLESLGLKTDVDDPLLAFTPYPMMLTRAERDEVPLMRHIMALNPKDGSGSFFGDVPVGVLANICLVRKEDIVEACRESMKSLLESAESGYEYSTILCISCCGRAMILGADADEEGRIISEMRPENISVSGAYCLGEISPTRYSGTEASNRFHNCSIVFCML